MSRKAIHGGEAKTDQIDAKKIAVLLRGGLLLQAYVYPRGLRETRDLLRRRSYLVRRRAACLTHLVNTNRQYNHPPSARDGHAPGGMGGDEPGQFRSSNHRRRPPPNDTAHQPEGIGER